MLSSLANVIQNTYKYLMPDSKRIILDHKDGIVVDQKKLPLDNLHALNFMPQGLFSLALTVLKEEEKHAKKYLFSWSSNTPYIVPNAFHWFSVSSVNYVRLVGLVDIMVKNSWDKENLLDASCQSAIRDYCSNYIDKVIPDVRTWRNKVSAHFAASDPFKNDNLGTLSESVMLNIGVSKKRYKTSPIKLVIGGHESELPTWSVTEVFESLAERYWPNTVLHTDIEKAKNPSYVIAE